MNYRILTPRTLLLVVVAISVQIHTTLGVKIAVEKRLLPFPNKIYLHCQDNNGVDLATAAKFYRSTITDGGQVVTELFSSEETSVYTFNISPESEGIFTCVNSNTSVTSSNNISLVAFPYIQSTFTLPQKNRVVAGHTSPPLFCGFVVGSLPQYYRVEWWRGTRQLNTNGTKYQVLTNLTLIVHDADITDASNGYFCRVFVTNELEGVVYDNTSPDISLQVYSPLTLNSTLSDTAITIGESTTFTCTAKGVPQPEIRWKIKGSNPSNTRYSINEQVTTNVTSYTVTSTLTITNSMIDDTGSVQCIGYTSTDDDGITIDSRSATLIVLGALSVPVLSATQDGGVTLSVDLPAVIPVLFSLRIRYISTADTNNNYETTLTSATFTDTATVRDYTIPFNKLPTFSSFLTRVAVQVYGVTGPQSGISTATDLLEPSTTPTATPSATPLDLETCSCTANTGLVIITALLSAVVVIMLVGITVTIVYFCCKGERTVPSQEDPYNPVAVAYRTSDGELKYPPNSQRYVESTDVTSPLYSSRSGSCSCSHSVTTHHTTSDSETATVPSDSPATTTHVYCNIHDVALKANASTVSVSQEASDSALQTTQSAATVSTATENAQATPRLEPLELRSLTASLSNTAPNKSLSVSEKGADVKSSYKSTSPPPAYDDTIPQTEEEEEEHERELTVTQSISVQTSLPPPPSFNRLSNPQRNEEQPSSKEMSKEFEDMLQEWDLIESVPAAVKK